MALSPGRVGQAADTPGDLEIDRQNLSAVEVQQRLQPIRQTRRLARRAIPAAFGDTVPDLGDGDHRTMRAGAVSVHSGDQVVGRDRPGRCGRRKDIGIDEGRRRQRSMRLSAPDRGGRSSVSRGAAIRSRPKDGTCSRCHSSKLSSTASGRPWRVMTEGWPCRALSMTAESVALASRNWISRHPTLHDDIGIVGVGIGAGIAA